ncbi:DNA-binding protein [Vulcanisaeta sp. EB80]|uniref:DNA-binding protein n=1 Tax=Vulcanisaeta sp. EB80 TaxID=1650660 RepID=UPI0009BFCD96|nr:DNA-binding protein [Vulcanisaeta sp. EB80]PLC64176.1 DNA-binding protein [Vulcanisaeta sp. EB80]
MSVNEGYDEEQSGGDEEIEAIRQRKMQELQRQIEEERRRQELAAQRRAVLRTILTPEARERLDNLRIVRPELVETLEQQLITLAQSGKVRVPITDEDLKRILETIYKQTHREFRIRYR